MPAKPLTDEQKQDAARLRSLFAAWKADRRSRKEPYSQEWVSEQFGFQTQSAVSQYLLGTIPLNPEVAQKFATLLQCQIEEFSDTLAVQTARRWPFPHIERHRFDDLKPHQKVEIQGQVREMIQRFERANHPKVLVFEPLKPVPPKAPGAPRSTGGLS